MPIKIECPKCQNDDVNMLDTTNHRREQMSVNCRICGHNFVYVFIGIPKEPIIKPTPVVNEWK
jgi:ribosomal protein S27E